MLHEDLEELLKSKVDKQFEELQSKKHPDPIKRKSLIDVNHSHGGDAFTDHTFT
jgi:hypothetical protein